MSKIITANREESILVAIDFQEKLIPAMKNPEDLEKTMVKLVEGLRVLGVQTLFTQQYTKGLGDTTAPIIEAATSELFDGYVKKCDFSYIEKSDFSAMKVPEFVKALEESGKKTIILCGMETHICVQQTCFDLLKAGYQVMVVADCVASRSNNDKKYSQRRMSEVGAIITTYESVLYEMLGGSKAEGFKQISKIVK